MRQDPILNCFNKNSSSKTSWFPIIQLMKSPGNVYGATKAFVKQFSLGLRADLQGKKVRVTDIEPGLVGGTEFSNVRLKGDDDKAANIYKGADALTPEDIAETVYWVATLPARMNVNTLELMPVCQTFAGLTVYKEA